MRSRICFVIPQFGSMPGYVDFFIKTATYSADLADFIFFTDQKMSRRPSHSNIIFKEFTLEKFTLLAREKLNVNLDIRNAYKLCDLKPMYGLIFEDYLEGYDYWGHCDYDIIFGDIERLLVKFEFNRFDIFCTQEIYASGPFQIFRNVEKVNRFFMHSPSWKYVLSEYNYLGFDEAGDVIRELWKGKDIWTCSAKVHSMTHLLKSKGLLQELGLKVFMKELITEKYLDNSIIHFNNGKLCVDPTNEELYIYHFMNRKNRALFNDQLFGRNTSVFMFTANGFSSGNRVTLFLGLILSLVKRYWMRFTRKLNMEIRLHTM